jgi:DNA-binding transcriptional MerR regulator
VTRVDGLGDDGHVVLDGAAKFGVTEHTLRFYTDRGLLPCERDAGNRRVFTEESVNWMQGIVCLKGCGASIEDIREYCRLCLLDETEENLRARFAIILKQREAAYGRLREAEATVRYMDEKVAHYEAILAGAAPDDSNPRDWTPDTRPTH